MRINQFSSLSSSLVIGFVTLGTNVTHAADITNKSFELRSEDCTDYVSGHSSSAKDVNRDMHFSGSVKVAATEDIFLPPAHPKRLSTTCYINERACNICGQSWGLSPNQ